MAASSVSICNDALIILGSDTITSLSDDSKEARLCNEQYSKVRDQLLIAHPWNFAIARAELSADADLPTGWWDWDVSYTLPSDVLRVLETDLSDDEPWAIEGNVLFCDSDSVSIKYIKQQTDTTKFSKFFEKALAYQLANRIAYALTQSATVVQEIRKQADDALQEARSYDAQEMSIQQVGAEDWLNIRS